MIKINNLFDSFNARYLSLEEVADSFIPNKQYEDLRQNNHSLLMGPRGSGKTTLLKMLTPACQFISNQLKIKPLPFWGVYIPSDIQWKRQIEYFEKTSDFDATKKKIITRTIVRTNIQIALIKTFVSLLEIHKVNSDDDFQNHYLFAVKLIESWKMKKPISADLNSIEGSLRDRLGQINSTILKVQDKLLDPTEIQFEDFYSQDYLDLIKQGCFHFESTYKNHEAFDGQYFRWGLCFDELEIAPKWLQLDLLDKLRSSEQNILFKLTTAPIVSLVNEIGEISFRPEAKEEQDFKVIRTWICNDYDSKSWTDFCKQLTLDKFKRRGIDVDVEYLFGTDIIDRNLELTYHFKRSDFKSYTKGSLAWTVFRDLAITDSSFFRFLYNKNINPTNPVPTIDSQIDSIFRKIKPLVVFRYQFMTVGRMRSRKNPSLYYGVPFLYELCDGNPRALMAMLDIFISNIKQVKNKIKPFTINLQSKIITQFSNNYLKIITANPESNREIKKGNYSNLGDLISIVGQHFYASIVTDPFTMDPVGSFVVDDKVPKKILELIELGVQHGAIIYLDPNEAISDKGVLGKTFRLSYLLHPNFKLPKREYTSILLSRITNRHDSTMIKQALLFDIDEIDRNSRRTKRRD